MNDICNVSKLMFTILYADDTCVLLRGTDLSKLIKLINSEFQKALKIIYKARSVLSKTSLVSLYYSYVYPYLTY